MQSKSSIHYFLEDTLVAIISKTIRQMLQNLRCYSLESFQSFVDWSDGGVYTIFVCVFICSMSYLVYHVVCLNDQKSLRRSLSLSIFVLFASISLFASRTTQTYHSMVVYCMENTSSNCYNNFNALHPI